MTEDKNATGTTKEEPTGDKIVEAATVKTEGAANAAEKKKADEVLHEAAKDAKEAECFDHGKEDAGSKK